MSRPPRLLSKTGLYHILFRGINRQDIFEEESDKVKFLEILKKVKAEKSFELYAYCLMSNHVHLFLKENEVGDIKKIMHKILTNYVGWYNRKYVRSGSLIGNRYKSEAIEDEKYFFALIRYIHQNPIKAGIVKEIKEYKWCSYNAYLNEQHSEIIDTYFILRVLSDEEETARKEFVELHNNEEKEEFKPSDSKRKSDTELRKELKKKLNELELQNISNINKSERNKILIELREKGFSIYQIERVAGISRGIISRVK